MAFCKACDAVIDWHKTEAGKNIPIDPEPHPEGNIMFKAAKAVYAKAGTVPTMYRSHFVTCTTPARFRKR
jgi:hypothetical protein